MDSKTAVFVVAHLAIFQMVQSQYLNRVLPITETLLPNQLFLGPNIMDCPLEILPNGQILSGGQILPNILQGPILPNVLPSQIMPNIVPSQIIPNIMPTVPSQIVSGPVLPPILPGAVAPTTIIQDSTVANNLANALQLLVVSNLLASKLPFNNVVPSQVEFLPPFSPCGYSGYNIAY